MKTQFFVKVQLFCFARSLMGLRPSRKTERHRVACSHAFFKKHFLEFLRSQFRGSVGELYTNKSIAHHHFHADKGIN